MTRDISTAASNHAAGGTVRFALLLELNLDSGDVNIWSGGGDLSWSSKTWSGVGDLGAISSVSETSDLSDARITATLSLADGGDVLDIATEFTTNDPVGRGFTLYLGLFNEDGSIDDVVTLTSGFIDGCALSDGAIGGVEVSLASEAALLARETYFRLDDQHQQQLFSGDKGLEFVSDPNLGNTNFKSSPVNIKNELLYQARTDR